MTNIESILESYQNKDSELIKYIQEIVNIRSSLGDISKIPPAKPGYIYS